MRSRSSRRFAAWLALAAMLASLALQAQAKLLRVAAEGPQRDLCVAGKIVHGAPASASHATHDCEACCASQGSAPPSERAAAPAALKPAAPKPSAIDLLPLPSAGLRSAFARAPPILL